MHVLILGAAGMLGRKLAAALGGGGDGSPEAVRLTLADQVPPPTASDLGGRVVVETRVGDLVDPGVLTGLVARQPDVVVHLAAAVSGEAERRFEQGYRTNLDGTRSLLEAIRVEAGDGYRPRLVFASSLAVFGPEPPARVGEDPPVAPQTCYGTQKAIGELLVADYSRRGYVDGVAVRLPTVCVRPGTPNQAASGFFSSILREPLVGMEAVLPVPESTRHVFASPRSAVGFLVRAATMDTDLLGTGRILTMPGLSATIAEALAALREVGGPDALALVRRRPDAAIARIVASWPRELRGERARELGFTVEDSMTEVLRAHVEDELGGSAAGAVRPSG